eukprot:TRINITY_DN4366_c0_g1_i1.p2 TRINITY_DN4366_c0_g1~~TRINITY_DN4366_c0_g1_i1.p2  ORF type:complete len:230 (-),score=33.53 TRINITY_DN4366_c0_g1_i1:833-1522(-)
MTELQFRSAEAIRFDGDRVLLGSTEWRGRKITHVNGGRVRSSAQLRDALQQARGTVRIRVKMTGEALSRQFAEEQQRTAAMLRAVDSTGCSVVHNQLAHSTRSAAHRHCPYGHPLEGSVKGQCDECGLHTDGLGCRRCDYDVCWACAPRPRNDIRGGRGGGGGGGGASFRSTPHIEMHSVADGLTPRVQFSPTPLQLSREAKPEGRKSHPAQTSSVRHYRFTPPGSARR